jgi:intracellular sulfur oxidation DsrE/DsrF family protein
MLHRLLILSLLLAAPAMAAERPVPETGPAVEGYGPVYPVPEGSFNLSNDRYYKVSKDLSTSSDSPDQINRGLESAARFLNMQARNGTPRDKLEMAVIVHGGAGKDMLSDEAYEARFGVSNPNSGLLEGLGKAGVRIYLCGQTAAHRGYAPQELNPAVSISLSAMAAHVQLQSEGYTLIPF